MTQSSSSRQKAFYYDESAKLSQQELETLHTTQEAIKPQKISGLLDQPEMINEFIDDLDKIDDRLENLKTEEPPKDLKLSVDDSFATSIETIQTDISEAIKLFILAFENAKDIRRIQENPKNGEEDTKSINMNKSQFIDDIRRCRQLLMHAEKIATNLGVSDTAPQNSSEQAV